MKAEEKVQIAEETRLKAEDRKHARLKLEEEVLISIEARRNAEEERSFTTES